MCSGLVASTTLAEGATLSKSCSCIDVSREVVSADLVRINELCCDTDGLRALGLYKDDQPLSRYPLTQILRAVC